MADPTDKATDPKPSSKSSAVKPPVLEGTARPASSAKPGPAPKPAAADKPEVNKAESPKTEAGKPQAPTAASRIESPMPKPPVAAAESSAGTAWLAGLVGGVVGLGAAYGLALLGYWPAVAPAPVAPAADPRIAQVTAEVPELQTIAATLQDELATLTSRVAGLEANPGEGAGAAEMPASDQMAGDIAALRARIDELAAAPSAAGDRAAENAAAIAALGADLAALRQASAETRANLDTVSDRIAGVETDLSRGTAAEAGQARLPLVVSGFETAFATGSPYDGEVAALRAALPDFEIPQAVLANAMTGLRRPDLIARDFNAILPDVLAGRPVSADAGWQEATADWFRGIIALRPTGAVEGDGPEAVVARLEGAIERGDFAAARTEFESLPAAMQAAAGAVGDEIASQAAAQTFLTDLRRTALAGGNGA